MRAILGLLYRRSLLEWDAAKQRYSVHDLVGAFGAARLADGAAVWERYARYYAWIARQADELYMQGGASILAGLALFDADRSHINIGWDWAEQHPSAQADAIVRDYAYLTSDIGTLRFASHRARILRIEVALIVARRQRDKWAESVWLGNLGVAYRNLGEVRRAIEYHEQALVIDREIGHRRGEGQNLDNLGVAYYNLGEVARAIEYHEQSLEVAREIGDRRGEGKPLLNLGNAYRNLGEVRRAIEFYEQSLLIWREIGDLRHESHALYSTGRAFNSLGLLAEAITYVETALLIYERIESPWAERVRKKLARWRAAAAKPARKPRKRRGDAT